MHSNVKTCFLLSLVALAVGLGLMSTQAEARINAVVSIAPQKYFVQKVGGDLVSVQVMVPPGADSHTYEPKPKQMETLAKADLFFSLGLEFENTWLAKFKALNPELIWVHTHAKVPRVAMTARDAGEHHPKGHPHKADEPKPPAKAHDHQGAGHKHQGLDPHIWLAPKLVEIQARAIRDGLVKADPANKKAYDRNLAAFAAELEKLDMELSQALSGLGRHKKVLVFHPAWGYFCRAYGLCQVAIEKEGKEPTAKGLASLIEQAKHEGAKVILVQPQFSTRSARTVARAIGGKVIAIDPLAPDWARNMHRMAEQVKKALY